MFSRTAKLGCWNFGMLHFLVVNYQVSSYDGPSVLNRPFTVGPVFET